MSFNEDELQGHHLGGVKSGITKLLRLTGNPIDNFNELMIHVKELRKSKSLSSIREMYQNMGMTKRAVDLITMKLKKDDDIIDDYDEDVDDTKFQQVFLINNNANIPAGTWVKYEPMKLWVEEQLLGGGYFVDKLDEEWAKYQERARIKRDKKRGIKYTKRGREVDKSRSSVDEFGVTQWKNIEEYTPISKIKSKEQFKDDFIKDVTWGTIHNIYYNGSKQKYITYTDINTNKLVKVQHFTGSEKWMKPEYENFYKDVNKQGYRKI